VLHFIDQETNEAISFVFALDDFDGTFLEDNDQITLNIEIPLSATNKVTYRRLSSNINGNQYFCQEVPPSSPQVLEEFVSTTGGIATLQIRITEQDDDDGVPAELEDRNNNGNLFDDDTDDDGIPDFLDIDDDNDNVETSAEAQFATDENDNPIPGVYVNTDGDDDPNYLDTDDDGDAVLTINEDLNYCEDPENPALNPANDINEDGLPNYLNPEATESVNINVVKVNDISRDFLTLVVFNDITFENQTNDESLTFTNFIMGRYQTTVSQDLIYDDTVISIDEAGNICQ
jgi:hypothetical protein